MFPCPDGSFWVLGANRLRKCSGRRWQAEAKLWDAGIPNAAQRADFFAGLSSLYTDSDGGIWLSHIEKGIGYVHPDGTVSWIHEARNIFTGGIRCWCEDHEGNIWIGLREGGLARVRPRVFHLVWPAAVAEDRSACSVCEDDNGTMFFGTQENQVLRWDQNAFSLVNLPAPGSFTETKVLPADNGQLWIGSVRRGVLELSNQQCYAPFPPEAIGGVARCLYRDSQGALWIGSEFGLFRWKEGELKIFSARDGFTPAYVLAITGDSAGDIWFGTALGELRRLHAGKFETFLPADSRTDQSALRAAALADPFNFRKQGALSGGERFWSLHFDAGNVLWIGTLGGGLLRFEGGKFTRFTTSDGLPSDNINQILEDRSGQLWLGTGAGIVRVAKSELDDFAHGGKAAPNFVTYDKSDGLPALECYGGSEPNCWRGHDGKLWFTTVKGAGWINPAVLHVNQRLPQIHIEEFQLDGREQVETGFPASLPATPPPRKMTVAAGRHYYEFRFCASSLTSPEKVKFKWRLAGLEDNWVDGGNHDSANYSFVPPGSYQFQVLACNNDGIWSDKPAVMDLTVLPYYWQRWWFKLAAGLCIAAGLMAAYSIRVSRLRMLEHLRLRIARDLHDEVGANLGSISLLAQIMEKKPSSTDAAQVHSIAAQTVDTLRDIIWFIDPTHDNLSDLVMRLQETSRVMLSAVSYSFKQEGDFLSANLSLPFRRNVPSIFKEVLHNLLRHSNASEAMITVRRAENNFQFQVRDNGAGFCPDAKNSGNGLKNMKRRAQEIGGQLKVESSPGHGTIITLTAPIA
jgi:signal transduction histidine kinase/streptogramin lyase